MVVQDFIELNRIFIDVALTNPVMGVLLLVGALLTAFSIGVFGYLTLGAVADFVTPDVTLQEPPQ